MPILSSDIKLRASERMTDTSDGGGRRTLNLIQDGVAGNIFPKVSRVDSVYGRVNLRKVYGHVDTVGTDTYAGAHFIVTDAPDNDRIHVTAFSTGSEYDTRVAARDRIESYVISGPESRMTLYGRQLRGAQALLVYQREEEPLPEIGEVYVVSNETGGVVGNQQFVAIQDLDHEVRTLTDGVADFRRRVITITIGAPLRYEFVGYETPSRYSGSSASGKVRGTTVADASRYFGIQPLSAAGMVSDLTLSVASVYTPIVPTTQRETPLSVASIAGASSVVTSGTIVNTVTLSTSASDLSGIRLNQSVQPGSIRARAFGGVVASDNGSGKLVVPTGPNSYWKFIVDYKNGVVLPDTVGGSGFATAHFQPGEFAFDIGVEVVQPAHTRAIDITLGSRGTVYTPVLGPLPAPGTLLVDYRALGKWYRLRDNGKGELVGGDTAYGTGTVNYVTGGVIITLGALPDVGSSVLLSWGSEVAFVTRTGSRTAVCRFALPEGSVANNTVSLSYQTGGATKVATDSGTGLMKVGAATVGKIKYTAGTIEMLEMVDAASSAVIDYAVGEPLVQNFTAPARDGGGTVTLQILDFPVLPYSVSVKWNTDVAIYEPVVRISIQFTPAPGARLIDPYFVLTDDGLGNMKLANGTTMGSVNYTTGVVTFVPDATVSIPIADYEWRDLGSVTTTRSDGAITVTSRSQYQFSKFSYYPAAALAPPDFNAVVSYRMADSESAKTATLEPLCTIDLTPNYTNDIIAGSVRFEQGGKTHIDRSGLIYRDVDPITGVGTEVGAIDYGERKVTLTNWGSASNVVNLQSCLTAYGTWPCARMDFRTAGSPIRPASLYVQVTANDGTLLTGLADQTGMINGTFMKGKIEQIMGVGWVEFGQWVTAAGNESQPWYDIAAVDNGKIWRSKLVQPETFRYSAVVIGNLPLNADILGLDPIRLPSDGRVPIYRPADVVVVHNTLSQSAGTPAPSDVISVGRTGLSTLWLEDANKLKLPPTKYVADLDAGTVTMAADLDLTGYVTPITIRHRIEEMSLLSDVQINGQLTLTAPLLRPYPLGSYVSSALLFGDMFSRVTGVFDQATWTGVWSDTLIGAQATAQYNDVDYPIEVLNRAAVSDRWRINFTSSTAFQVVSENMGVITTGTTGVDLAPVNPLTGLPYFTLRAAGWGMGWSVGNQLRFSTVGAVAPIWLARTVLPGATLAGDSFDAQLRGDVD